MEGVKITLNIPETQKTPCLIIIGMAGSGKTTFIEQLQKQTSLQNNEKTPFFINLDPAVTHLPYYANIDIRNKIKYKDVMKQFNLGPNGAILTSLNLFSTSFDEVINIMETKQKSTSINVIDTPGQIEVFSWSASGSIISQSLATTFPTVLVYVIDIHKCQNPNSFMSNMLFCCSIFYKMRLPIIVLFNKCDIENPSKIKSWLNDYEAFMESIKGNQSYLSSLSRSLCLVLDEFYKDLNTVFVSSLNGEGFESLWPAINKAVDEYYKVFLPDIQKLMKIDPAEKQRIQSNLKNLQTQLNKDKPNIANPQKKNPKEENMMIENNTKVQIKHIKEEIMPEKEDNKQPDVKIIEEKVENLHIQSKPLM